MSKKYQISVLDQIDALSSVHIALLNLDTSISKEEATVKLLPILDLIEVAKEKLIDYGYYIGNL